jgi:hypothetical protein
VLQRDGAFAGWNTQEKVLNTDVFIQVWSVDTFTVADQAKILPLFRRAMEKARKVGQRNLEDTSILQFYNKSVILDMHP